MPTRGSPQNVTYVKKNIYVLKCFRLIKMVRSIINFHENASSFVHSKSVISDVVLSVPSHNTTEPFNGSFPTLLTLKKV